MDIFKLAGVPDGASAFFVSAENAVAFMGGDSMKLKHGNPDPTTYDVYHVDGGGDWDCCRAATIWQSFGKPKVEKIAEEK